MAKMNARFGFRKNNNAMDWNRFLLNQQSAFYENMAEQNPQELENLLAEKLTENIEEKDEKK